LVSAALFCGVKGFIGRFEGRPWIRKIKHVRNTSGECNLAQWFIRLAVSQATFGHLFAQAVKFLMRFGQADASEQHNKLLSTVARYMAIIVRNRSKHFRDKSNDPIACIMAVRIIDALKMVYIAESGSVAKIVKLEHAWRRLDGRNDDGFQVAPFPG
jgi:hypothetical protein